MIVRWYVLPLGERYSVRREAKPHGTHETRQRAIDAALFMARIEADKQLFTGEISVEDDFGRMVQQLVMAPRQTRELPAENGLTILQVGLDRVRVPA
jgi:hypothetical protein